MSKSAKPAAERRIAHPEPTPGSKPYWDAAAEGRLMIGACRACKKVHHYPRAICPQCFSTDVELKQASGKGTIYTYSVMRRVAEPYTIAYITLEEGVTMMTNLVDCDFDKLAIGQKVAVVFKASEKGQAVPMFKPV